MPTLGYDCGIILTHPNVNGGQPYGFLVDEEEKGTRPGGVQITHEVSSDGSARIYVLFDVVLADFAINPNGTKHTRARIQDYEMLMLFLAQQSGISLQTYIGLLTNLFATGFTADERHLPKSSLVKCQLNNTGVYWPPIDESMFSASTWDGILTWATSYWR